jgi:hypothetical protein
MRLIFVAALTVALGGCASQPQPGAVDFPTSCSRAGQIGFDRAVALLHNMTYPQARAGFQHVTQSEPGCAMAHWGVAMTLFQPLWPTRPTTQSLQQGWDEVQKAKRGPLTPREAVALVPHEPAVLDWNRFAWPEAITHFARGLGATHLNDQQLAAASVERLAVLEAAMRTAGEEIFANNIQMFRLELSAWVAHASGKHQEGIDLLQQAAAIEASTPKHAVTPGPTLPAEELLGDMLMEQGRPADAVAAYRRALALYPNRLNSLRGVARPEQATAGT